MEHVIKHVKHNVNKVEPFINSCAAGSYTSCTNTCALVESFAPNAQPVISAGYRSYVTRRISTVLGDGAQCGVAVDAGTYVVTLNPGSYIVSGIGMSHGTDNMAVRFAEYSGATKVRTVAMGSMGFDRATSANFASYSVLLDAPLTVSGPSAATFKFEMYTATQKATYGGGITQILSSAADLTSWWGRAPVLQVETHSCPSIMLFERASGFSATL